MSSTSSTSTRTPRARTSRRATRNVRFSESRLLAFSQTANRVCAWVAPRVRLALVGYLSREEAQDAAVGPPLAWMLRSAVLLQLCLLGLVVIAPLGGLAQTVSPLARAWPWLLLPAQVLFPNAALHVSARPEHIVSSWPANIFASLLILGSVLVSGALLRCLRQPGATRRHLVFAVCVAAVLGLTLALLPSMPSDDIFSYVIYGRIAVLHHANPLVAVPASFPQDPFLSFVYWRNVRSVYGPIWLLASNGVTLLAQALGGALATYVFLFKLLGLLCHLINMVLIWQILGVLAPRRRLFGTLLYGWSPLCLLEFSASGHNDALMLTFMLTALLLLARGREMPALVVFGLAIATKYVPVALLPFYLVVIARQVIANWRTQNATLSAEQASGDTGTFPWWRDRRLVLAAGKAIAWRAAVVLGVVFAATIPFWSGPSTLEAVLYSPPAERLDNSLLEAISQPLHGLAQLVLGLDANSAQLEVDSVLKIVALLAFVALWLLEFRRASDFAGALEACGWALLWYMLVASGWFWPWYVTWLVVIVALLPWSELSVATLLLAGGVLVLYGFRPANDAPLYGWRAFFEFGPALVYLIWHAYRQRHQAAAHRVANSAAEEALLPASPLSPLARLRG